MSIYFDKMREDFKRAATRPSIGDMVRSAELSDVVFFLRQEAHNFRCDTSPHVRNLKPIDCDDMAGLFDAIADRIERFVVTSPAMDRALPGIPMVRVLDPDTGKEVVRGWYAAYPETTYCFAEDYKRNPPRLIEGVVCWQMTDWGLPNRMGFRQVTSPHRIEVIPSNENRQDRK